MNSDFLFARSRPVTLQQKYIYIFHTQSQLEKLRFENDIDERFSKQTFAYAA